MSRFSFQSDAVPAGASVVSFQGDEALSTLFSFQIHLLVTDDDCASLDLDAALGARGTLTIDTGSGGARGELLDYHGVLADIEIVHARSNMALLRVTLVPKLSELALTRHSRMFTKKSAPDVLRAVLDDGGLAGAYELRLHGNYPTEEHICAYKESHYDFLVRWMEREGLYYFFDHTTGTDQLVIVDHASAQEPCQDRPVRYHPVTGRDVTARASLSTFRQRAEARPANVRVKDYDYDKPGLNVASTKPVSDLGLGDVVMFSGRFFTPGEASRLATLRAEGFQASERVYRASGTVFGLRPGYTFELDDHPRDALNQRYLVTAAHHEGSQTSGHGELLALLGHPAEDGYRVDITAIPASVQFRKAPEASWPKLQGFEHGTIDGPGGGDYAQIDEQGRYQVKIHFDESDLSGGKATTWLRMMQPHAGAPEGFHFPLRKGTEVAIGFHGGDPDRPFIAGVVPNGHNPSLVTAGNHTLNVLQTGGLTRLEMEDLSGSQYIDISTPPMDTHLHLGKPHGKHTHYIVKHTDGDCRFEIGAVQDIDVGGTLKETVTGHVKETYSTSQTSTITGPQKTTVNQPVFEFYHSTQHTQVKVLRDEIFNAGHLTMVGGPREEIYEVGQHSTVLGGVIEDYVGGLTRTVTGATSETYAGALSTEVTGQVTQIYPTGVQQNYGAVTANWKSFDWVAGPIHIVAPRWKIHTPHKWEKIDLLKDISFIYKAAELFKNSTTGLKIDITETSVAGTGVKIEANGAKIQVVGPSLEVGANKVEFGLIYVAIKQLLLS